MLEKLKIGYHQNMKIFVNKQPNWNNKLQAYTINFNGRITKPSSKNF